MRILLSIVAAAAVATPALASSIESVTTGMTDNNSIETISCDTCPPLRERRMVPTYHVDPIEPGTQKVEIREVDGEAKIFRTEAWFGGSAVVHVKKASEEAIRAAQAHTLPVAGEKVDMVAMTSAVDASAARAVVAADASDAARAKALDASAFELRLD